MPDFFFENAAKTAGKIAVCGVDEAGRGPLAGPVCAAAVILPDDCYIEGLNDSKKLTERARERLYPIIIEKAVAYSIAFASVEEIEGLNILNATMLAMTRAVEGLPVAADYALIDGNRAPSQLTVPSETVVKGHAKSCSIAAASVLAKVTRDRLMDRYDEEYPQYEFKKHKGYGTAVHTAKIREFGPSPIHRMSFLGKILCEKQQ